MRTRRTPKFLYLNLLLWLGRSIAIALGFLATGGTLLSFSKSQHWLVRLWDFPRVQITAGAAVAAALFRLCSFRGHRFEWGFVVTNLLVVLWQARKIYPYTPLSPVQVKRSTAGRAKSPGSPRRATIRLLITNVLMENTQHERLVEAVRQCDPDVVLAVEVNARWEQGLEPLVKDYPHVIRHPQENYYGLMLYSRFPLSESQIDFLVQPDIPSVHTRVELPSGDRVFLHGIHPRPPEPLCDQLSTPRDAELVLVGKAIREAGDRPTIVAGDLNDVAWSPTSELFLRLSGLLDPRVGRGFYNSYNAHNRLMRYPLDHVFHSNHFRVAKLKRLPSIGSDHFPVFIELSYEPAIKREQPATERQNGDEEEAREKVENQVEAARTGDDRPRAVE